MREVELTILADSYQVLLADKDADWEELADLWTPAAAERKLAVGRDFLAVGTARNTRVPISIRISDQNPPALPGAWDMINEAEISLPSGVLMVSAVTDHVRDAQPVIVGSGEYRVRVRYAGLGTVDPVGLTGDDSYVIELWRAP